MKVKQYDDPWPNPSPQRGLPDDVWEEVCRRFGLSSDSVVTVTEPMVAFILNVHRDILSRNREEDLPGLEDIEQDTHFLEQLERRLRGVFSAGSQFPGRELTAKVLEAQETLVVERMMEIAAGRPAETPWELLNKGNALHRMGRLEEALGCYDQAVQAMDAPDALPLLARSRVLEQLHCDARALDDCRQAYIAAIQSNRCAAEPLVQRAFLFLKLGEFHESLREANRAARAIHRVLEQRRTGKHSFIAGDEEVPIAALISFLNDLINIARILSSLASIGGFDLRAAGAERLDVLKDGILAARNKLFEP